MGAESSISTATLPVNGSSVPPGRSSTRPSKRTMSPRRSVSSGLPSASLSVSSTQFRGRFKRVPASPMTWYFWLLALPLLPASSASGRLMWYCPVPVATVSRANR